MENTVNDFWRMIWDYQSKSIVMLCRMKEDGKVNAGQVQWSLLTTFTYLHTCSGGMPHLLS